MADNMAYKYVIDNFEYEMFQEEYNAIKFETGNNFLNSTRVDNSDTINSLFDILSDRHLDINSKKEFLRLHKFGFTFDKIRWKTTIPELIYLVDKCIKNQIFIIQNDEDNLDFILRIFLNSESKKLIKKSLVNAKNELYDKLTPYNTKKFTEINSFFIDNIKFKL